MLQALHKIFLAALLLAALPAVAQDDPPARVGRLASIENEVFFRADRSIQAEPATLNWPISSGAILETGRRGRAEVWIGSTAYRIGDNSQAEFTVVDDNRVDLRVNDGSLAISILDRDQVDDVVVTTPDGLIRFLTPGRYRIDVHGDHSELTVQAGRATFDDRQREVPVAAGQKLSRWSDGRERLDGDWGQDAFDRWVAARENATLATNARRHVSPHMTGYQDLDAYGDWQSAPDYGTVWYPRGVADDWAPYRYGRWAWVAPWGWTWVDQAPWGFAPFHYGRWAMIQGRWGWVPGRLVPRPVYAPALVAWVGNPGWNVSFSFGAAPAVGWFPLAPREVYVPGYRYSERYVERINVTHVTNVTVIQRVVRNHQRGDDHERHAYRDLPRAMTVVPANLLRDGRPISRDQVHQADRRELERAPSTRQAPGVGWIAPPVRATRSPDGERNGFVGRDERQRQDGAAPQPRDAGREGMRREPPAAAPNPEIGPRHSVGGRDVPDRRRDEERRDKTSDDTPSSRRILPPPAERPTQPESRRDAFGRTLEAQPEAAPPVRRQEGIRPDARDAERDARTRGVPDERRPQSDVRRDVFGRTLEAQPEAAPMPRPLPPVQRPDANRPDARDVERDIRRGPPDERNLRREVAPASPREFQPREIRRDNPSEQPREMPRPERSFQREAPAAMPMEPVRRAEPPRPAPEVRQPQPQREMPVQRFEPPRQPAPEVRGPAPQPSREMHQPRAEPPRPQGGQGDPRRRQDEERGPR